MKNFNVSPRLQKMRRKVLNAPQEISIVRAKAFTEIVSKNPDLPRSIQFAKAFEKSLNKLSINIEDDQRIIGSLTEKSKGAILYPELKSDFLIKELDNFSIRETDSFIINDQEKQELRDDILPFWKEQSAFDKMLSRQSEKIQFGMRNILYVLNNDFSGSAHQADINYERIIKTGYKKVIIEAENALLNMDKDQKNIEKKRNFFQSIVISSKAIIDFAARYSRLAYKMAGEAESYKRRQELINIAEITKRVPAEPARNLREAVQSYWFIYLALKHLDGAAELPLGRLDQVLYPYYKQDLDAGKIEETEALELITELFIKYNQLTYLHEYAATKVTDGGNQRPTVTIGGVDKDGNDAVNSLSNLILQAVNDLNLIYPNTAIRLNSKNPESFWTQCIEMMTNGSNLVEVFNDEANINGFINLGYPEKEARDYIVTGCVQPIPDSTYGPTCSAFVNAPKLLELTLNSGKPYLSFSGEEEDLPVENYKSFIELLQAVMQKFKMTIEDVVEALDIVSKTHEEMLPNPIMSAVIDGPMKTGKDIKAGGARHNFSAIDVIGFGTLVDSLAAVKDLVFKRKLYSLEEVVEWLKFDFEGFEEERQILLNKAPKYGNDDPEVDEIAREVVDYLYKLLDQYRPYRGGKFGLGLHSETHHVIQGVLVAATPDGRRAGEMLSPGCGPTSGMDVNGPTASLRSLSVLDFTKVMGGSSANLRFNPDIINSTEQIRQFGAMLKAYFKLGGQHLQISVADAEILREAQQNPEQYEDLIVRITGYSARFVELTPATQEEIIRRTEMQVC